MPRTLLLVLILAAGLASQDTITIPELGVRQGRILALDREGFTFLVMDESSSRSFAPADLEEAALRSGGPITVKLSNGDRITGRVVAGKGVIRIESDYFAPISLAMAALAPRGLQATPPMDESIEDIVLEVSKSEEKSTILEPKDWNGKVALLGMLRQGNVDSTLFQLDMGAYRQWAADRFMAEAGFAYGTTEGEATARNAYGRSKWDHFYDEDLYSYGSADLHWDEIQNLDLRAIVGVGVGLNVWRGEGDHRSLDVEAGISGIYEQYSDESGDLKFALRAAAAYLDVWGEKLLFTQRLEVLLPIPEAGSFIVRSTTALEVALSENWFLKNVLEIQYLGDPPVDTKSLDLKLLVGIEYKF
jgi:putative salt-induced outer membrane protein YdiY